MKNILFSSMNQRWASERRSTPPQSVRNMFTSLTLLLFLLLCLTANQIIAQCGFNPNWTHYNETCLDYNDGQICCSPSGGTGPFSCTISPVAGTQVGSCFVGLPPSTTPYTVTITDGNGCQVPGVFTIIGNDYPAVVITPSSVPSCGGSGSACVSVTGGSGAFNIDWFSDSGFINYIGSGNCITQSAGTYWYRVEDTTPNVPFTECVNSGPVTITSALPSIGSVITPNTLCQCPGGNGSIDITLTGGTGPFTINWTGPNGFTAATADISGLCEGIYTITVTSGACSTSSSYTVGGTLFQITSNGICASPMQNDCDCHTIATNTTWNPTLFGQTNVFVDASIIVPAGVTLTIDNLNILITPHHVIRILPGGQLISHGSVYDVTCGSSWRGFEVVGSGLSSTLTQRGYLEMEQCQITHAECGARNYRAALSGNCSLATQAFTVVGGTTGGRINCYGETKFVDNIKDLALLSFYDNGTDANNYGGRFNNCIFLLTDAGFPVPSEWSTVNSEKRIHLQRMVDVSFINCQVIVDNDAYSNSHRVMGVFAEWSDFFWDGTPSSTPSNYESRITGCRVGIWIAGSSVTTAEASHIFLSHVVNNTYFENYRSIDVNNSRNLYVMDNYFADMQLGFTNSFISGVDVGARTASYIAYVANAAFPAMNYIFAGNSITTSLTDAPLTGVYVYNTGAHNNFVYDNRFVGCSTGCVFNNINRGDETLTPEGTHYECNRFQNCGFDVKITDSNPSLPNGQPNQGVAPIQGNYAQNIAAQSAGNKFTSSQSASNSDDVWIPINNPAGHIYRYWPTEVNGGTAPTEMDADVSLVNVQSSGGVFNLCNWPYLLGVPQNPVPLIAEGNQNLIELYATYHYLIDGGNTQELKSEVENSTFSQALTLYQQLLSESPALSEEVMIAAIQKEYELPKSLLVSILSMNPTAAKSAAIKNALEERIDKLDEYQMQQVMNGLQLQSVKEDLETQMSFEYSKMQKTKDDWSRNIESNGGGLNDVLEVYQENIWPDDRLIESDILIRHGHCAEGILLLDTYSDFFNLKTTQQAELTEYIQFAEAASAILYREDPTMTESEENYFYSIYENNEFELGIEAVNLLNAFGGYVLQIEIPESEEGIQERSMRQKRNPDSEAFLVYPNPANEFVILKSSIQGPAMIEIVQVDGRLVQTIRPDVHSKESALNLSNLQSGMYILLLYDFGGLLLDQITITKN